MQAGDLVRITRRSIGVPKDSIGLVLSCATHGNEHYDLNTRTLYCGQESCTWTVMINGRRHPRRYLEMDLEVVSASR